jgi:hypothetical protein
MTALPKDYNARKALPLFDFLTKYFPLAVVELTKVAVAGNEQHNPGEPLHWARGKSMDQLNTAMRHMFDHGMGNVYDETSPTVGPTMHLAKAAWRLLAEVQLLCEARDAEPVVASDFDRPFRERIKDLTEGLVLKGMNYEEAWSLFDGWAGCSKERWNALDDLLGISPESSFVDTHRAFEEAWG